MTHRIRVTVHHQKRGLPAGNYKIFGVIAGHGRASQKIAVPWFFLEIFDPPRSPECFQFLFRKFRHAECYMVTKRESYKAKSLLSPSSVGEGDSLPVFVGRLCQTPLSKWRFTETPYNFSRLNAQYPKPAVKRSMGFIFAAPAACKRRHFVRSIQPISAQPREARPEDLTPQVRARP